MTYTREELEARADGMLQEPHYFDMQDVVEMLNARGVFAFVQHTGGGVATIYAGGKKLDEYGDERRQAVAGPGTFFGPDLPAPAYKGDFYVGPDNDGGVEDMYCSGITDTIESLTEQVIKMISENPL